VKVEAVRVENAVDFFMSGGLGEPGLAHEVKGE
jgi:hypothetical protein